MGEMDQTQILISVVPVYFEPYCIKQVLHQLKTNKQTKKLLSL